MKTPEIDFFSFILGSADICSLVTFTSCVGADRLHNRYNKINHPKIGTKTRIIKVGSLLESRNRLATSIIVGNVNNIVNAVNTPPPKDIAYRNP